MKFQRECLYPYVRISYTATLNISPIRNSSCQIVSWKKPTNAIPIPMFRSVQDLEIASVYIFEKKNPIQNNCILSGFRNQVSVLH